MITIIAYGFLTSRTLRKLIIASRHSASAFDRRDHHPARAKPQSNLNSMLYITHKKVTHHTVFTIIRVLQAWRSGKVGTLELKETGKGDLEMRGTTRKGEVYVMTERANIPTFAMAMAFCIFMYYLIAFQT